MNVNFEYYKIFFYVAKYKNFTKAAHVLHNSQPNVTRAMNCLEQELHCILFVRTNRGVYLTPEGEKLYVRVSAAMQQFQLAEEELSDGVDLEHGTILIGASEIALNIFLLDYLRTFHREYPGVRLKISNHSTPQADPCGAQRRKRFCRGDDTHTGRSAAQRSFVGGLSGYPDWWSHVCRSFGTKKEVKGSAELSFDLSWAGDNDLPLLP